MTGTNLRRCVVLLLFIALTCDTWSQENDSLKVYKKIKRIASKYRLTRMAYEAVFRDPEPKEYPAPASSGEKQVNPYLKAQGAVIRNIYIRVYDPFGYSVTDTIPRKINLVQKAGNNLHITTRRYIVINRLLFKENDKVDALKISESERLLREAVFINDAKIELKGRASDSVDVLITVHDRWPITLQGEVTDRNANGKFRNSNLFGWGQQFEQYVKVYKDLSYLVRADYHVPNIDKTFISSRIGYNTTPAFTTAYINFDKPFYSFFASWAGGVSVSHNWQKYIYTDTIKQVQRAVPLNAINYDLWAGKMIKLSDRKTLFNQSTNILLGARHYNSTYLNRPSFEIDTARSFRHTWALLGNVGFAVQQYYKDKYIYRFGANEDVPEGLLLQFTYGGLRREFRKIRYYNGIEIARAKHFSFGYLSATFSYGIYYNLKVPNDVTTNYQLHYFSELMKRRRWFFRQFLYFNLLHGENKMEKQTITLRAEDLYGFQSGLLAGNTKMVLNSETVAYMPYNLIGFKFAPVLMIGLGMLGDQENALLKSRLYQGYSLGLMMRNENLLVSTFQVSVGMYPFFGDKDDFSFVYNPVASFNLRIRGFSVGRPEFIAY